MYFKNTNNLITRFLDSDTTLYGSGKPVFVSTYINANSSYVTGLELISKNNHIGFETDIFYRFANQESRIPCQWSTIYESVIGDGYVEIITDEKDNKIIQIPKEIFDKNSDNTISLKLTDFLQ